MKYIQKKVFRTYIFTKYFTLKKLFNAVHNFYYFKRPKNFPTSLRPIRLVVDTGNVCQLKCPLCPTGNRFDTRETRFMTFDSFKTIIDEVGSYLYEIDLYNWGEPFLNKDIFNMISYAEKSNIKTNISSHFNSLSKTQIASIISSGLNELIVSLDGASSESYAKYRVGGDFDNVVANMRELVRIKRQNKVKNPRIVWQFIVMKHNEHEFAQAKRLAEEIGVDELNFRPTRSDMAQELFLSDREKINSIKDWLPGDRNYLRYKNGKKDQSNQTRSCHFHYTTAVVNANGSVSPCCGVYDEKWDFGNAFDDGLSEVWNNNKYRHAREAVAACDESDKNLVCTNCIKHGFLSY